MALARCKPVYTVQSSSIAHALAAATLSKYYVQPNLPPSVESSLAASSGLESKFNSIPEAIEAIQKGQVIIVVDNEDRENEGDFVWAAEESTDELLAFVIRYSGGVICVPMPGERLDTLMLPLMVTNNEDSLKTAYTISVDYKHGTTTGISSHDRARTLAALSNPATLPTDLQRPGHVFPLRAVEGGVLKRVGHTEASLDLCRLAGKQPCAGISEVVLDAGGMARRDDLLRMAKGWGMCVVTIDALVRYRVANGV
ncbi:DHBP synthase RibB-like alpha/beta domain-containing protein [Chytriomyces sp. MP71]|nr:DHBP synthase RibB-like alpha/beta domain-containing protein [Chytriomyces sp. MP71]